MKYIELPSLTGLAASLSHQGPECNVSVRMEAYACKNIKRDKRLFRDLEKVYWDDMNVLEGMKYDPLEDGSKNTPTDGTASSPSHSFLAQAHSSLSTPFGPLGSPQSRKTLYLLIATLNVAFPDYTFDSVKPSSFIHLESGAQILNALSTTLLASRASVSSPLSPRSSGYASLAYGAYPAAQGLGFGVAQGSPGSPYETIKQSPYAPSNVVSGTHPEVYALLDDVIGPLDECEVFEYVPEPEEDPNAGEGEDDEDEDYDDGYQSEDRREEEDVFSLDEDMSMDMDMGSHARTTPTPNTPHTPRGAALSTSSTPISPFHKAYRPRASSSSPARSRLSSSSSSSSISSSYPPMTPTGSGEYLLWSSHWFFYNRKQKRILYVTVWARKRSLGSFIRSPIDEEYFVFGDESEDRLRASARSSGRRIRKFSNSDESEGSPVSTKFHEPRLSRKSGEERTRAEKEQKEKERFVGWEGAVGAGARAMGLGH